MNSPSRLIACVISVSLLASSASAAIMEIGDAGALPAAAYSTGTGPLDSIFGHLDPGHDVDLYAIEITDVDLFSATTVTLGTGFDLDTQLFLFRLDGSGVVANDDDVLIQSTIPPGYVLTPGLYFLAIAEFPDKPVGASGAIFPFSFDTVTATGTDPVTGWSPLGPDNEPLPGPLFGGNYQINLQGAVGAQIAQAVPEPSSLAVLAGLLLTPVGVRFVRRREAAR